MCGSETGSLRMGLEGGRSRAHEGLGRLGDLEKGFPGEGLFCGVR